MGEELDTRQAILAFSQGEKIKGGLIWASQLVGMLDSVFGGERHETRQISRSLLEMIRQEVHIAKRIGSGEIWDQADRAIERAIVMVESGVVAESVTHLTMALSHVTTIIQRAMNSLEDQGLLK